MGQSWHFALATLLIFAAVSLPAASAEEPPPVKLAPDSIGPSLAEADASSAVDASPVIEDSEACDADGCFHPTFRLRGRIDTDFLWSDQSALNRAVFGDLPDAFGLRRARIGAEGNL